MTVDSQALCRAAITTTLFVALVSGCGAVTKHPASASPRAIDPSASDHPAPLFAGQTLPPQSARPHGRVTARYTTRLSGHSESPPGPPHASGSASIKIHNQNELCWQIRHLIDVRYPAQATLRVRVNRTEMAPALLLGVHYHRHGCVPDMVAPTIKAIERHPARYSVSIATQLYPYGALSGNL